MNFTSKNPLVNDTGGFVVVKLFCNTKGQKNPIMTMPLFQMASCCFSCFKGGFIVIVRMRSSMIVRCVSKFFYCCIQSFFCLVFMLIDQFIFLRVEISFHWCIIIWISGFTHTLCDCHPLTVFCKIFRSILASLITM